MVGMNIQLYLKMVHVVCLDVPRDSTHPEKIVIGWVTHQCLLLSLNGRQLVLCPSPPM